MTRALIDGDELIFKACAGTNEEVDWDSGDIAKVPFDVKEARNAALRMLNDWLERASADGFLIVLSPRNRLLFRRGMYPAYKAGRSDKPEHFWTVEEFLRARFETLEFPGLEADDTMGLLSGPGQIIVSSDKDMKTVPGPLYNPGKKQKGVITQSRADWQWMYQTLMGDSTDGFHGCMGCGSAGAEALLADATCIEAWWPLVVERFLKPKTKRYADHPQGERDAVLMAQLARILRPGEYDPKTGEVAYRIARRSINFNAHDLAN